MWIATVTYMKVGEDIKESYIIRSNYEELQDVLSKFKKHIQTSNYVFLSSIVETIDGHFEKEIEIPRDSGVIYH